LEYEIEDTDRTVIKNVLADLVDVFSFLVRLFCSSVDVLPIPCGAAIVFLPRDRPLPLRSGRRASASTHTHALRTVLNKFQLVQQGGEQGVPDEERLFEAKALNRPSYECSGGWALTRCPRDFKFFG
jgi:hypothetical protein